MFNISDIIKLLTALITTASVTASILPNKNKKGERIFTTINSILNIFAFNFKNAKNKD